MKVINGTGVPSNSLPKEVLGLLKAIECATCEEDLNAYKSNLHNEDHKNYSPTKDHYSKLFGLDHLHFNKLPERSGGLLIVKFTEQEGDPVCIILKVTFHKKWSDNILDILNLIDREYPTELDEYTQHSSITPEKLSSDEVWYIWSRNVNICFELDSGRILSTCRTGSGETLKEVLDICSI